MAMGGSGGLVLKGWYFCYFSCIAVIVPYLNLYLSRMGLSEQQIGVLAAFRLWITFPAGSLWSGIADKLRAHRAMVVLLFMVSTVLRLWLAAAHSFGAVLALALSTELFGTAITIIVDAAAMASCSKEGEFGKQRLFASLGWGVFSFVSGAIISNKGIYSMFVCHATLALLTLAPTALLPVGPLHAKHSAASSHSGSSAGGGGQAVEEGKGFSEVALCGAAGDWEHPSLQTTNKRSLGEWPKGQQDSSNRRDIACSLEAGTMAEGKEGAGAAETFNFADREGVKPAADQERQPLLLCPGSSASASTHPLEGRVQSSSKDSRASGEQKAAGVYLPAEWQQGSVGESECHYLHQQPTSEQARSSAAEQCQEGEEQGQPAVQYWHGVRQLLLSPRVLVFFSMVLVMGYGVGNIESYLFLYLDSLGASETLMGASLAVTCTAEFLVFWFAGHLLRALGDRLCMHLVFLAFLVRLLCYATLPQWGGVWKVLLVEPLHGFTFALAWATGTAFVSKIAPPGLESTTQALFQGLYYGIGFGIGGLVGGIVYQHQGPQCMYWAASAVMLAGWLLGGAAEAILDWHSWEEHTN